MLSFGKINKERWNVFHIYACVRAHSGLHLGVFLFHFFHVMRVKCWAPRLPPPPAPAFSINNKRVNAVASQSSRGRRPYFTLRFTVGQRVYVCVGEFVYLRVSSHQRPLCYSLLGAMLPNTATWREGKKKKNRALPFQPPLSLSCWENIGSGGNPDERKSTEVLKLE